MAIATALVSGWILSVVPQAPATPADLLVEAWISTAGPYGESWHLTLTPGGHVALEVFYMSSPSGNLMARFSMSEEYRSALRKVLQEQRFFDLPADIAPQSLPLHQPHLKLDIALGNRKHTVALHDPHQLEDDPRARRFLKVWHLLYQELPLKPSW